jgi:hypothetical protein
MKKETFFSLRTSHLSNNNANSLFQSTIQMVIPVRTQLGDMVNAILDQFISSAQKFGEQVNAQHKSKLTDPLKEMDKKNDNLLSEIKRTVVFMSKSRDLNKKTAAQEMEFFLTPYWDVNKHPVKTQAEDTTDMFAKYHANVALQAAASELGIDALFTELEASNTELNATYLERNKEIGNRSESGSDLRPEAETAYIDLCNMVEQAANFTPSPVLQTLFNDMDALRRKYAPLATGGKDKLTDTTPTA